MKKLLLICLLFAFSNFFGQEKKEFEIIIDSIKHKKKKSDKIYYTYTFTVIKDETKENYFNLDDKNGKFFFIAKIKFFYKAIDNKVVTVEIKSNKISIIRGVPTIYDLEKKGERKLFIEKLEQFYNYKEKTDLEKRVDALENEKKVKRVLGNIEFFDKEVTIYTFKGSPDSIFKRGKVVKLPRKREIKIDSVFIYIKRGSISEILIKSETDSNGIAEIFHTDSYPITLESLILQKIIKVKRIKTDTVKDQRLVKRQQKVLNKFFKIANIDNPNEFIYLNDVLRYIPQSNIHYVPDDKLIEIKITDSSQLKKIKKSVFLKSYIEAAIYTDLFSLLGEEANGQIQTEFSSRINLNVNNFGKKSWYFFNYIKPNLKYSIFKEEDKYVEIFESERNNNNTEIFRRNFLDLGLKLNIFRADISNRFEWDFNIGTNYTYTKIRKDEFQGTINLWAKYTEIELIVREFQNFGLITNFNLAYIDEPKSTIEIDSDTFKSNWFFSTSFELFYFPVENKDNKLFFKFQYIINTESRSKVNDFSKIQVGYKIPIKFKIKSTDNN